MERLWSLKDSGVGGVSSFARAPRGEGQRHCQLTGEGTGSGQFCPPVTEEEQPSSLLTPPEPFHPNVTAAAFVDSGE